MLGAGMLWPGSTWAWRSLGAPTGVVIVRSGTGCNLPPHTRPGLLATSLQTIVIVNQVPAIIVSRAPSAVVIGTPLIGAEPVWVQGFWHWMGGEWIWVANQWLLPGHRLGVWRWSGSEWVWVPDVLALSNE
jgi:hypothetical protein